MVNALLQEFSHSLLYHFGKYKFTSIDKKLRLGGVEHEVNNAARITPGSDN